MTEQELQVIEWRNREVGGTASACDVPALIARIRDDAQTIGWLSSAQALWIQEREDMNTEIQRLRGLIKQAEWGGGVWRSSALFMEDPPTTCPWCEGERPEHEPDCAAFPPKE